MDIKVTLNKLGMPTGKLADVELHFTEGPLAGLKLGTTQRGRLQRHLPRAAVFGERHDPELRAAASVC
jgi:sporulation protein YlmC with PRC-barrel domain